MEGVRSNCNHSRLTDHLTITAEDGIELSGNFRNAAGARTCALLLHMMPATKESYAAFAEKLAAAGIASLAIDFRGHGKSADGPDGYRLFSDTDHQASLHDIEAGARFLQSKGATTGTLVLVGASIGANLALQYAAAHADVPAVVALSPGLNYRGVLATPAVTGLQRSQRLYLAASNDDAESDAAVERLAEISLAKTTVKHFDRAGHGTTMFERIPEFMDELVEWINMKY